MAPTLFHHPMACSTACRIAAAEGEVPLAIERVNVFNKTLVDGGDYHAVNPLGQVATLRFDDGRILTENAAILLWIQSRSAQDAFCARPDSADYFRLVSWLCFCATELHKHVLWPIFRGDAPEAVKQYARTLAPKKLAYLDNHLAGRDVLIGERMSAADAYLVWILLLTHDAGIDIAPFDNLRRYRRDLLARPAVAQVVSDDQNAFQEMMQRTGT